MDALGFVRHLPRPRDGLARPDRPTGWRYAVKRAGEPRWVLDAVQRALMPSRRPTLLLTIWRWRYEAALVVGGPLLVYGMVRALGSSWTQVVLLLMNVTLASWPAARRRLVAQCWCVVTQHRLRTGLAQTWLHTRDGRLPAILWCAPTACGEQVVLWCPAGLTVEDICAHGEHLAAACYAIAIAVEAHPTYSHLVRLEVIRREMVNGCGGG